MKNLFLATMLSMSSVYATAQSTCENIVNASGGSYESGNMTFEWNVGELSLVNTMQSTDGKYTVTNGCLQPLQSVRARSRALVAFTGKEVSVLPNPASERIYVRIRVAGEGKMNLVLVDEKGDLVYAGQVNYSGGEANATINLQGLLNGTYILQVKLLTENGVSERAGTYKIIKIS